MPSVASLSRDLQSASSLPLLVHSLHETRSSVLSLAANENYIFSGSQNQDIAVRPPTHSWKFVQGRFQFRFGIKKRFNLKAHCGDTLEVFWVLSMLRRKIGSLVPLVRLIRFDVKHVLFYFYSGDSTVRVGLMRWLALRLLPHVWIGVVGNHFGTHLRHYTIHGRGCWGPLLSDLVLRVADDFCWMSEHIATVV